MQTIEDARDPCSFSTNLLAFPFGSDLVAYRHCENITMEEIENLLMLKQKRNHSYWLQ